MLSHRPLPAVTVGAALAKVRSRDVVPGLADEQIDGVWHDVAASLAGGDRRWSAAPADDAADLAKPVATIMLDDGRRIEVRLTVVDDVPLISVDDWFDQFWRAYPRKVGKPKALEAFKGAMKRSRIEAIAEGLGRWCDYWEQRGEPQFVPHASTWLNQDRFNDPTPAPPRRKPDKVESMLDGMRRRAAERAAERGAK